MPFSFANSVRAGKLGTISAPRCFGLATTTAVSMRFE
jgi:hypothetical protein